jgi:hypothetical protein
MRRFVPPLVDQLLHQIAPARQVSSDYGLRLPDRLTPGAQPQLAFADRLYQQLIAGFQTGCRAALCGDYDPALLVDPNGSLHDICSNC